MALQLKDKAILIGMGYAVFQLAVAVYNFSSIPPTSCHDSYVNSTHSCKCAKLEYDLDVFLVGTAIYMLIVLLIIFVLSELDKSKEKDKIGAYSFGLLLFGSLGTATIMIRLLCILDPEHGNEDHSFDSQIISCSAEYFPFEFALFVFVNLLTNIGCYLIYAVFFGIFIMLQDFIKTLVSIYHKKTSANKVMV